MKLATLKNWHSMTILYNSICYNSKICYVSLIIEDNRNLSRIILWFSTKTYVVDIHQNCLGKAILMDFLNICFLKKSRKSSIRPFYTRSPYNSKLDLTEKSLWPNTIIITKVLCTKACHLNKWIRHITITESSNVFVINHISNTNAEQLNWTKPSAFVSKFLLA